MKDDISSAVHTETRRLAAIMFTDIVGFSRQMGTDEAHTLRLLQARHEIFDQLRQMPGALLVAQRDAHHVRAAPHAGKPFRRDFGGGAQTGCATQTSQGSCRGAPQGGD